MPRSPVSQKEQCKMRSIVLDLSRRLSKAWPRDGVATPERWMSFMDDDIAMLSSNQVRVASWFLVHKDGTPTTIINEKGQEEQTRRFRSSRMCFWSTRNYGRLFTCPGPSCTLPSTRRGRWHATSLCDASCRMKEWADRWFWGVWSRGKCVFEK
jgi:hypothetical protein